VTGLILAKAGVTIDVATAANASADATTRVGMPIFLMFSDIFPRLPSSNNVIIRDAKQIHRTNI
jgi:hypothetical protein